jgi:hypothetical protein
VLAVGGTSLYLNNNGTYSHESGWSGSGGGVSQYESEPSFQTDVQSTGNRTEPDVSIVADPYTGVAIYDSYDNGSSTPWEQVGGTSLATPLWAALIAIADQGRVLAGATMLDGPSQTLPYLYDLPSTDFHDITSGSNDGETAGSGYDEVTGIGSPIANLLVPDLADWGLPNQLVITTEPASSVAAGSDILVTVKVETPAGSVVTGASGTVSVGIVSNPGGTTLIGTVSAVLSDGVASFTADQIDTAANGYTLRVSDPGYASVLTSSFDITPGPAAQLVISAEPPSSISAGSNFGVTVEVEDAYHNVVTSDSSSVTLSIDTGPTGATLGGTDTVTASSGNAGFTALRLTTAGNDYALTASDGSLASASTTVFTVNPLGAAALFIQSEPPALVTAGQSFGLTVKVVDTYGNTVTNDGTSVSIAIVSGTAPVGGTLGGTVTGSINNSGLAVFSALQLTIAGAGYELRASAGGLSSSVTTSIAVNAAAASQLVMSAEPPWTVTAGAPFGLTVALDDRYGNLATADDSTVSLSVLGPNNASLVSAASETPIAGLAAFTNLLIDRAGAGDSIYVTDGTLGTVLTTTFAVQAAAPAMLAIHYEPTGSISAGSAFAVQVAVEDMYGNATTDNSGSVSLAIVSGPGSETLNGTTSVTITDGTANFTGLSLDTASPSITLEATSTSLTSATIPAFAITPGAPAKLVFLTEPAGTITAGANFALSVQVEDTYGNIETSDNDTLNLALQAASAGTSLHGGTSSEASGGIASFTGISVHSAGAGYTITASDGALAAATTSSFAIVAAAPAALAVVTQPPPTVTAGVPFSMSFAVADLYGNIITGATNDLALTLIDGPANSGFAGTAQAAVSNGTAIFSGLTLTTAASGLVFEASSSSLSSVSTQAISVVAAAASHLVIVGPPPSTVPAGTTFGVVLSAEDPYGNVATSDNQPVNVSLVATAGAALGGAGSADLVDGVLSYSLNLDTSGQGDMLSFAASGLASVTTPMVNVVPGAPARLAIVGEPPASVGAGSSFGLDVAIEDAFGNVITTDSGPVSLRISGNPAGGVLGGTTTISASGGEASFSGLTVTTAGSGYSLSVTAPGVVSALTTAVTITPGPAAQLVIETLPASVSAKRGFALSVLVEDAYGNLDTAYTGQVTAALAVNPVKAKFSGSLTVTAAGGMASFNNLVINKTGKKYEVRFTAPGLAPQTTTAFKVSKSPAKAASKIKTVHAARPVVRAEVTNVREDSLRTRPRIV